MWIKIHCIEYILWRILTTKSIFECCNSAKKWTVKDVPANNYQVVNLQACSFISYILEKGCTQYLVVRSKYWAVPLISARVSCYCQFHPFVTMRVMCHNINAWKRKLDTHRSCLFVGNVCADILLTETQISQWFQVGCIHQSMITSTAV